jgi:hypothetical protein
MFILADVRTLNFTLWMWSQQSRSDVSITSVVS